MTEAQQWSISGEYFESCSCDVVCPCEISPQGFMQAMPDNGYCNVILVFHVMRAVGDVDLADRTVVLVATVEGPMAHGNWTAAVYLDDRVSDEQHAAMGAIFGGAAGGPPRSCRFR